MTLTRSGVRIDIDFSNQTDALDYAEKLAEKEVSKHDGWYCFRNELSVYIYSQHRQVAQFYTTP